MNFFVFVCLSAVIIYGERFSYAEESVCVVFRPQNITACGNASTWAANTPNLTVDHTGITPVTLPFVITYYLQRQNSTDITALCDFFVDSNDSCSPTSAVVDGCQCVNFSADSMDMKILITEQAAGLTTLSYYFNRRSREILTIHTFTFKECPLREDNATAVNVSSDPCQFGCTSQFRCPDGYEDLDETIYRCNAAAFWEPTVPTCVEVPPAQTDGCGVGVTVAGGILIAATVAMITYMAKKTDVNLIQRSMITWYVVYCVFVGVIAAAVGICFGIPDNYQFYVAGSVIGSLGLVGMAGVIIRNLRAWRRHEDKSN